MKILLGLCIAFFSTCNYASLWDITYIGGDKERISIEKGLNNDQYRVYYFKGNGVATISKATKNEEGDVLEAYIPSLNKVTIYLSGNPRISLTNTSNEIILKNVLIGFYTKIAGVNISESGIVDIEKFTDFMNNVSYRAVYKNFQGNGEVYPLEVIINNKDLLQLKVPAKYGRSLSVEMPKIMNQEWSITFKGQRYILNNVIML